MGLVWLGVQEEEELSQGPCCDGAGEVLGGEGGWKDKGGEGGRATALPGSAACQPGPGWGGSLRGGQCWRLPLGEGLNLVRAAEGAEWDCRRSWVGSRPVSVPSRLTTRLTHPVLGQSALGLSQMPCLGWLATHLLVSPKSVVETKPCRTPLAVSRLSRLLFQHKPLWPGPQNLRLQ